MSGRFTFMPMLLLSNKKITDSEKILYSALSGLSAKDGYAYASNEYLQALLSVSERSLQRRLKHLEEEGFIRIEQKPGHGRKIFVVADLVEEDALDEACVSLPPSTSRLTPPSSEGGLDGACISDGILHCVQNDNISDDDAPDKNDGGDNSVGGGDKSDGAGDKNDGQNNKLNNIIYNTAAVTGARARDGVCEKGAIHPEGGLRWNRSCPDEDFGEVMRVYQEEIGLPSTAIAFEIEEWLKKVDKSLILYAIKQAVFANSRRYNYINGVLRGEYGNGARTASDVVSRRSGSGSASPKAEAIRRERAVQIGSVASDLTEKQRQAEEILRRFKERRRNE